MRRLAHRAAVVALLGALTNMGPAEAVPPALAGPDSSGATASDGTFGLKLLDAPVSRKDDPRARSAIIDHVLPGAVIKRRVQVENHTGTTWRVELYAGAANVDKNGFTFAEDRKPAELTGWISLDRGTVDVPAHGRERVWVTIVVPSRASKGERYGVIWAEAAAAPDAEHNIGMVNRVGIRVYLDVGLGGEPPSDFEIVSLVPGRGPDGRPFVLANVRNTGERALDMSGSLRLDDGPGAISAGPYPVVLGTTLGIRSTAPVRVYLDKRLPNGPWSAELTLRSGLVERTGRAELTFPEAGLGPPVRPEAANWFRNPLLVGLAGAVLLVVPILLLVRVRARRGGRHSRDRVGS